MRWNFFLLVKLIMDLYINQYYQQFQTDIIFQMSQWMSHLFSCPAWVVAPPTGCGWNKVCVGYKALTPMGFPLILITWNLTFTPQCPTLRKLFLLVKLIMYLYIMQYYQQFQTNIIFQMSHSMSHLGQNRFLCAVLKRFTRKGHFTAEALSRKALI